MTRPPEREATRAAGAVVRPVPAAVSAALRFATPDERSAARVDRATPISQQPQLVSFGTRHTASSQTDPFRRIGAPTTRVVQQFQAYAPASGGNMTVQQQTFVQPVAPNIPAPTTITNVIATLNGSVAGSTRTYVIVAHFDDRVTDLLDFTSDAPGADRDASGVAVVMELARVMAAQVPNGTILFSVVAGEEQGLLWFEVRGCAIGRRRR